MKWPFGCWLEVTTVGRFFYESLTLNSVGTFFTDCKSGGGRSAEVTVIRGSTAFYSFFKELTEIAPQSCEIVGEKI